MNVLQAPLVGRLVRHSRLCRFAREAASGNKGAIAELCQALDSGDRAMALLARNALSALPETGQAFCCSLVIDRESRILAELCREQGYTPRDPADRAMFFLFSGKYDTLESTSDAPALLARAYQEGSWSRRFRILRALSAWGRPELLFRGMTGIGLPLDGVPDSALDLMARRIASTGDHETLSQLLFSAPLPVAFTITGILKGAGYRPPDGDPEFWRRLYAAMPDQFRYPEPADDRRSTLSGGGVRFSRVTLEPTGRFLAAGCRDGSIEIRKITGGDPVSIHHPGAGTIFAASSSPDGKYFALGGSDGVVYIVDLPDGGLSGRHESGVPVITALSFSPDSRCLACGGQDGAVTLLRPDKGCSLRFAGHPAAAVTALAVTGSGTIISGHEDGTVMSWSPYMPGGIRFCPDHEGPVLLLSVASDGLLISASSRGPILFRDSRSGLPAGTAGSPDLAGTAFAASRDWVAAGDATGTVTIFTVPEGREVRSFPVHRSGVSALCASPDGTWCAAGTRSGMVHILGVPEPATPVFFSGQTGSIRQLSAAVAGAVASVGQNGLIEVRRTDDGTRLLRTEGRGSSVTCISADPASGLLAVAGPGRDIHLWDLPSREYRGSMDTYTPGITDLVLLSCGTLAAVAGSDGSLLLIRVPDGTILRSLRGHSGSVSALAGDLSSPRLAAGGWDGTVFIHDLEEERSPILLRGHASPVTSLSFSPDGNYLASTSQDRTARIWDVRSGTTAVVLPGHRHVVSASAFSPDGSLLATGSWDATVRLWSVPDGTCIAVLKGHRDRISRLVFTGQRLFASGDAAGSLCLWTIPDGQLIRFHESSAGKVTGLLPVGAGREILTAHEAGTCVLRDLPWTRITADCTPDDHVRVREYLADAAGAGIADLGSWQWIEVLLAGSLRTEIALCPDPPLAGGYEIELAGGG